MVSGNILNGKIAKKQLQKFIKKGDPRIVVYNRLKYKTIKRPLSETLT